MTLVYFISYICVCWCSARFRQMNSACQSSLHFSRFPFVYQWFPVSLQCVCSLGYLTLPRLLRIPLGKAAALAGHESLPSYCVGSVGSNCSTVQVTHLSLYLFFITKLHLILCGVPQRNKKHWEGVIHSPPGVAQKERGYLRRGRKHKRNPLQTGRKGMPSVLGPVIQHGGTGSRHTGIGQERWTQSHKATWVHPQLSLSASSARSPSPSA